MALLWSKKVGDTCYEVRSAGNSRRLYTNGVLHSAYNPSQAVTGSVWDLILLPALYSSMEDIKRVLILGAGGGAVINLLNRYIKPASITAVDIDEVHLKVAKQFFNVKNKNVELVHADAIEWVHQYNGEAFDLVIEDLFIEQDKEPIRLMHEDVAWLKQLQKLTTSRGSLVINHGDQVEARFTREHVPVKKWVYQFSQPLLQNRVLVLRNQPFDVELFERNLQKVKLEKNVFNYFLKSYQAQKKQKHKVNW